MLGHFRGLDTWSARTTWSSGRKPRWDGRSDISQWHTQGTGWYGEEWLNQKAGEKESLRMTMKSKPTASCCKLTSLSHEAVCSYMKMLSKRGPQIVSPNSLFMQSVINNLPSSFFFFFAVFKNQFRKPLNQWKTLKQSPLPLPILKKKILDFLSS